MELNNPSLSSEQWEFWIKKIPKELLPDGIFEWKDEVCQMTKEDLGDFYYDIKGAEICDENKMPMDVVNIHNDFEELVSIIELDKKLNQLWYFKIETDIPKNVFREWATVYKKYNAFIWNWKTKNDWEISDLIYFN